MVNSLIRFYDTYLTCYQKLAYRKFVITSISRYLRIQTVNLINSHLLCSNQVLSFSENTWHLTNTWFHDMSWSFSTYNISSNSSNKEEQMFKLSLGMTYMTDFMMDLEVLIKIWDNRHLTLLSCFTKWREGSKTFPTLNHSFKISNHSKSIW